MIEIVLGVVLFTAIVLALVGVILGARRKLVAQGSVDILVNEQRTIQAAVAPDAVPQDLKQPGHIFPLMAQIPSVIYVRYNGKTMLIKAMAVLNVT